MSAVHLLGMDLGTSGLKCVLIDDAGQLRASAFREYAPDWPRSGWAEQDPAVWLQAAIHESELARIVHGLVAASLMAAHGASCDGGAVFSLYDGLELMRELGANFDQVLASGGGTKHPL